MPRQGVVKRAVAWSIQGVQGDERRHGEQRPAFAFCGRSRRHSRGRLYPEPPSATRSDFRRDCDRIIHSTRVPAPGAQDAGVRLSRRRPLPHPADPHPRSRPRLRARSPARSRSTRTWRRRWRSATTSAIRRSAMPVSGRSTSCLKRLRRLRPQRADAARRHAAGAALAGFDGLNLTWETLEGLVKHNGPLIDRAGRPTGRYAEHGIPGEIAEYNKRQDLELWSFASRRGAGRRRLPTTSPMMPTILMTACVPACSHSLISPACRSIGDILARSIGRIRASSWRDVSHEFLRRLITRMIEDVIGEANAAAHARAEVAPATIRAAAGSRRRASRRAVAQADEAIKAFSVAAHVSAYARNAASMRLAEDRLRELFAQYFERPGELPAEWRPGCGGRRSRAGATDRRFHCRNDRSICSVGASRGFLTRRRNYVRPRRDAIRAWLR